MTAAALVDYIAAAPSPYHAVAITAKRLESAGFSGCEPSDELGATARGFVRRGGSLVAWNRGGGDRIDSFRIIGAHSDSPNLRVRPRPEAESIDGRRLGLAPYGGILRNSWLDRDLGLAGRVGVRTDGQLTERLFATDSPVLKVPQLAIHLDREVSTNGLQLNPQDHLNGLFGCAPWGSDTFAGWLAAQLDVPSSAVLSWDVMTFDTQAPQIMGADNDLLSSARLDNLCSCFGGAEALIEAEPLDGVTTVLAIFDHEEVGSVSSTGAASPVLAELIARLSERSSSPANAIAARSRFLSADMAHATHLNYPEMHDSQHPITLDGGPVIKIHPNQRYATDAMGAAEFQAVCDDCNVATQTYSHRSDMGCGSTIGPTTAARLGIDTIDVGMPQLSMHSARETMAASAVATMVQVFAAWLSSAPRPQ